MLSCNDCIHKEVCECYAAAKDIMEIKPESIAKSCDDYLSLESFLNLKNKLE